MSAPVFIKLNVVSCSICLLLLVICNSMLIASATQSGNNNNNNTNSILKAIQEAPSTDSKYLRAKVTVEGLN
jgi:hypothetical protein